MKKSALSIYVFVCLCAGLVSADLVEHLTFDVDGTAAVGFDTTLGDAAGIDTADKKAGAGSLALSGAPTTEGAGNDGAVTDGNFDWSASDVRTVAFWMKAANGDTGDAWPTMISMGLPGSGIRWDVRMDAEKLRFEVSGGGYTTASDVADGTWHHIVVVIPVDNATLADAMYYIDGAYVGNFAGTMAVNTGTAPLRIGDSFNDTSRDFKGNIDDVQMYDSALSSTDIEYLYDNPGSVVESEPRAVLVAPADEATAVSVNPVLEWAAPDGANIDGYDVYFGTDSAAANNPKVVSNQLVTSYSPATLASGTAYYWRVDIHDGASVYDGLTWAFTTTGRAFDPDPYDGETTVDPSGSVSWSVDPVVASCDVYVGTDINLTYVGNYTANTVSKSDMAQALSLSMLGSATTYQWQVDTRDSGGGLLVEGDVWSFTVKSYVVSSGIIVEDFDSYADNSELFVNWTDGGGSTVQIEPLTNILEFSYDNTTPPYDSKIGRSYVTPQNWTEYGSAAIEINYLGTAGNDVAPMYIVLDDGTTTKKVINPTASVTDDAEWHSWRISLTEFADSGVQCDHIVYFEIGFGDGAAGGSGVMYLNDIMLAQPACLDAYRSAADLDGDCDVDSADLFLLAADWLRTDYPVAAQTPPAASLRAHYAFEQTAGYDVLDSSGNGFDAQIQADSLVGVWQGAGVAGSGCVNIADANVLIPAAVFSTVSDSFTLAFWINGDPADWPLNTDTIEFSAGPVPIESNNWDRLYWRIDSADSYGGQWNHYTFVKDVSSGTLKIYHNGVLAAQNLDAFETIAGGDVGATLLETLTPSGPFKVDEFYVYDTALTQSEIVDLLSGAGSEVTQPISPVLSNADIHPDGSVNIADFAVLSQSWLELQIWP